MQPTLSRFALATAAATFGTLIWGIVYWMWIYEYTGVYSSVLPGAEAAADALVTAGAETGTYFWPWPRNTPESREVFVEAHRNGPFFKISYVAEGIDSENPMKMLWGTLVNGSVAAMGAAILWLAGPNASFGRRFGMVFLAGCMGTVFIEVGDPVWFHLPWDFPIGIAVYELTTWAIIAGVLAAVVAPRPALAR